MKTIYEWDYETVNEDGDIEDHHHADKLGQYSETDKTDTLVLVRDEGDNINGLDERYWAYVRDGKLPEYFTNAMGEKVNIKVPQKFHKELYSYLNS